MDNLMDTVKQRANSQFDTQKGRATDSISAIAGAVRQSTQQLRDQQQDGLAQYVERAADQLERFSTGLRDKSADELIRDVRDMARRQPALFIGGSFAVGLLAARFLKSSRQGQGEYGYSGQQNFGRGGEYGYTSGMPARDIQPRDYVGDVEGNALGTWDRERF